MHTLTRAPTLVPQVEARSSGAWQLGVVAKINSTADTVDVEIAGGAAVSLPRAMVRGPYGAQ